MLSDTDAILDMNENLFRFMGALKKGFQVMSEGKALIHKKNDQH